MNKNWIIVKREFFYIVKQKGYILNTLGLPFLMIFLSTLLLLPNWMTLSKLEKKKKIGILDSENFLDLTLPSKWEKKRKKKKNILQSKPNKTSPKEKNFLSFMMEEKDKISKRWMEKIELRKYSSKKNALIALKSKEILVFYIFPKNYLKKGEIEAYYPKKFLISPSIGSQKFLRKLVLESLFQKKLSPSLQNRIQSPFYVKEYTLNKEGIPTLNNFFVEISKIFIPYFFAILFMFSLVTTATYFAQGISEEKENRVIEILLASITAEELFRGKLLGLGGAGLLQFFVWTSFFLLPIVVLFYEIIPITPTILICAFLYFILGIFSCGALTIGFGSLSNRLHESYQFSMIWPMISIVPIFFLPFWIDTPNHFSARILSYIPFTSPLTMMIRISTGEVFWIEILLSVFLLALSCWYFLKTSSRIFRVGILCYGKRPEWKELWKFFWKEK